MTLIATYITREGIVHAADSNLSDDQGPRGIGTKVFDVPHLHAGLCVSGAFSVRGRRLDEWLDDFISRSAAEHDATLRGLAEQLRRRLQREMTSDEKSGGSLVHVAGFVQEADSTHPEFYVVRNIRDIDPVTGDYINVGDTFLCDEQLWSRDYRERHLAQALASGGHFAYVNGFPSGRITYLGLDQALSLFFQNHVWRNRAWSFRPPKTLEERKLLIELQMSTITTLFTMSDYPVPYIGGKIRTVCVLPPGGEPWLPLVES